MTVLGALQSAMVRLVGRRPNTVFSTTSQTELELTDLVNEVAVDIMKSHDWQALTKIETITADGSTTDFDLPADYDRMALGQAIHDSASWFWNYTSVGSLNDWLTLQNGGWSALSPGWWIILQNQLKFHPAPHTNGTYAYISNEIVRSAPASGTGVITTKTQFTADDDTFVLSERLLTLGVVWRYREQKGMGYAEDMASYETALSQEQARDKGSRVISHRISRTPAGVRIGWPWPLGPDVT